MPSLEVRTHLLNLLTEQNVDEVYSGRPGCGCGCKGKYGRSTRFIRMVVKELRQTPDKVLFGATFGDRTCLSLETETRFRWVYIKTTVFDQLMAFITNPIRPEEVAL